MSEAAPPPDGVNVMLGPVGNSPGPDVTVSVTVTLLLIGLPLTIWWGVTGVIIGGLLSASVNAAATA